MTKVILYIAVSSDGFIAGINDELDFLKTVEREGEDYGYDEFYNSIDALVMGSNTYRVVSGFGDWVYAGKPSYVLSGNELKPVSEDVTITKESPENLIDVFRIKGYKNIWLVGGGKLFTYMMKKGLVDEMVISIIPVELGEGIPLFVSDEEMPYEYELVASRSYDSDLVQNVYRKC